MAACYLLIVNDPQTPATFKTDYAECPSDVTLTSFEIFTSIKELKLHTDLHFADHRLITKT